MGDDFILEFKLDWKNEWIIIKKTIPFHIATILGFIVYILTNEIIGLYLVILFSIVTIPHLILHIQYRIIDRNKKIIVNHSKQTIKLEKNGKLEREFHFSDICKLIRHKGQRDEENLTYVIPSFFYNYTEIVLKNKNKIYYTDLISKNIGVKNIEIVEKISVLNIIKKS